MPSRSYSGTALSSSANDASISETSTTWPRPSPEHVAVVERREDALHGEHPGERVAEGDPRARRRLAREAVDVSEPAHRLGDRRVARTLGVRARSGRTLRSARARCPGSHPRAGRSRGSTARACRDGSSRRRRLRRGRARAGAPALVAPAEIERDAFLVPRLHRPPERPALVASVTPVAERIGLSGRLDLDHLGAHVAEQAPGERPREQRAELDHPHARERARPGRGRASSGHRSPTISPTTPSSRRRRRERGP